MLSKNEGLALIFGAGAGITVPPGWKLVESPETFAIGIDPSGQEYYLSKRAAYPRRVASVARGLLKPGDHYIDTECGVVLFPTPAPRSPLKT